MEGAIIDHAGFVKKLESEFTSEEQRIFVSHFLAHVRHRNDPCAFVVEIDDRAVEWLGFSRRDAAVRAIKDKMSIDQDFTTAPGGHNKERYMLTVDAFKDLCMLAGTEKGRQVRRCFVKMQKILLEHLQLVAEAAKLRGEILRTEGLMKGNAESFRLDVQKDYTKGRYQGASHRDRRLAIKERELSVREAEVRVREARLQQGMKLREQGVAQCDIVRILGV